MAEQSIEPGSLSRGDSIRSFLRKHTGRLPQPSTEKSVETTDPKKQLLKTAFSHLASPHAVNAEGEKHELEFIVLRTNDNTLINIEARTGPVWSEKPIRRAIVTWMNPESGRNGEVFFDDWTKVGNDVMVFTRIPTTASDPEQLRLWTESVGMSPTYKRNLIEASREMTDQEIIDLEKSIREGVFDEKQANRAMGYLSSELGFVRTDQPQLRPGLEILDPE